MGFFTKESLERLKNSVDLVEVISSHIDLKRAGSSYKACCPFHDEKTPSFVVNRGDSHYHCYGCSAHGDAIQFLMDHLKMSFQEAVESLADRFNIYMERETSSNEYKGPSKETLKKTLEEAIHFYHSFLLNSPQNKIAIQYLNNRGIDKDFICKFKIGLAPNTNNAIQKHLKKTPTELLLSTGLVKEKQDNNLRDFFVDRILFPIRDPMGTTIGFSGRKYKEETFGPKYVNTPETPLFKKSTVLFGLHYCRRRIIKEKQVIIVEGQLDTLRLIYSGFDISVSAQGTAFGETHIKKLIQLGVNTVYLAFDSDSAGMIATQKIGAMLQKEGIEVFVIRLPDKQDPDSFLQKNGAKAFSILMKKAKDYLTFIVNSYNGKSLSPAKKHELATNIASQIRSWNHPVMIFESLKKLSFLLQIPETSLGIGRGLNNIYIKHNDTINKDEQINPDKILEGDLIRWLLLMGESCPHFIDIAQKNISTDFFNTQSYKKIYDQYMNAAKKNEKRDLLTFMSNIEQIYIQEIELILQKKINRDCAEKQFTNTIQKILERNWLREKEKIHSKIQNGQYQGEELSNLVKQFDNLNKNAPKIHGEGYDK